MKSRLIAALAAGTALALAWSPASAQRPAPSPEQRIDRLERQVQQMQQQVFPRGRPADTAGFIGEPAATQSSVVTLSQRLDSLERQMADLLRLSEENGNRLRTIERDLGAMRSEQEQRIGTLEQRMNEAAAAAVPVTPPQAQPPAATPRPQPPRAATTTPATGGPAPAVTPAQDLGEQAYTEGFRLWEAGQYDQAITALRAFTSAYPRHRRVSFANNLIGRALLDKGEARAAAEALLANYRGNPNGERAPDSLFYLGQALMRLGQPAQACRAYAELDAVYGAKIRPDLKKLQTEAKAQAQCS